MQRKARRAPATLVAQHFSCPDGEHCFIREPAHRQLWLLNILVARMESTALYGSPRTGNFSVAATKKLLPVAARPILEATEMLLITIERSCLSVAARTGN